MEYKVIKPFVYMKTRKGYQIGDVVTLEVKAAKSLIDSGFIEAVVEELPPLPKAPKSKAKSKKKVSGDDSINGDT